MEKERQHHTVRVKMFDKRLMKLCPESRKYIVGNVLLQWLELICNALIFYIIAGVADCCISGKTIDFAVSASISTVAVIVRFIATKTAVRMSWYASKSVKRKMRELIYSKLLKLGSKYREQVSTAELVQESVEGVDQLETPIASTLWKTAVLPSSELIPGCSETAAFTRNCGSVSRSSKTTGKAVSTHEKAFKNKHAFPYARTCEAADLVYVHTEAKRC